MNILFNNIEIVIVIVVVLAVAIRLRSFLQRKKNLRNLAKHLGMEFSDLPLDEQSESELARMKDQGWVRWFQKFISLFSPWEIRGTFHGMPVRMSPRYLIQRVSGRGSGAGERKDTYMRIEVPFPENLDLGLQIYADNPFVKLGHDGNDDRRREIQSGMPELDNMVNINGISEERIVRILNRTDLLQALLQLYRKYSHAVVDDECVRIEEPQMVVDVNDCRARLEALSHVATCIERAIRFA
jgi:hypothetical protein